jgi:hypothetical protein
MDKYHGIVVDVSQKDKSIFHKLKVIGNKEDDGWTLYKIESNQKDIEKVIKQLQENMVEGFYFHFYSGEELIVVFNHKIFKVKTDKSTWGEIIKYGKSLNIPEQQLDFYPCKVEDEEY